MGDDEEHEHQHATDRDEPPELDDGEFIVDMELFRNGTLRSKILLSRWRCTSVKQAGTLVISSRKASLRQQTRVVCDVQA